MMHTIKNIVNKILEYRIYSLQILGLGYIVQRQKMIIKISYRNKIMILFALNPFGNIIVYFLCSLTGAMSLTSKKSQKVGDKTLIDLDLDW